MRKFNLSLFFTFLIIFILILAALQIYKNKQKSKSNYTNQPLEPNYFLKPSGSYPSHRYMNDPAEKMDTPYYEGPYGDMILPSYLGMYDENPDYQDYAGIYPT